MSSCQTVPAAEILEAIGGPIEPVKLPLLYRLATLLVAIAMVLLPLIYVGLIGVVVYLLYLHLNNAPALFASVTSGNARLFLLLAPLVVGGILVLFMIKPLFARRPQESAPLELDPSDERTLFGFVHKICTIVGAPKPRKVYADCQVNASASLRRGTLSFFGNDLVLTIGLPLVAGLELRQFAGVLAHEFGHFAQGTGMRLTYVIRRVNHWFSRVVYERDEFDLKLEQWAKESDLRIGGVLHTSRLFVWMTRKLLWVLMMVGHGISCFLMRQMEFDADRYETRVSGSDTFESTAVRLQYLKLAAREAFGVVGQSWQEGRLAEDLPRLVEDRVQRIPPQTAQEIRKHIRAGKTGWFDTHPADQQRIESARREQAPGIFRLQAPATLLFRDFDAVSKRATVLYYTRMLGDEFKHDKLVSNATLVERDAADQAGWESFGRFFPAGMLNTHPLSLPETLEPVTAWEKERERLRAGRDSLAALTAEARKVFESSAEHGGGTPLLVEPAQNVVDRYLEAGRIRLTAALRLLRDPRVVERLEDVDERTEKVSRLLPALCCLERASGTASMLRQHVWSMTTLFQTQKEVDGTRAIMLAVELSNELLQLRDTLDGPYPFAHAEDRITIGHYVVGTTVATENNIGAVCGQSRDALARFDELTFRILGALARIAEGVEEALGLKPLAATVESEEQDQEGRADL